MMIWLRRKLCRNVFIANLALSDLCLCAVTMPLTFMEVESDMIMIVVIIFFRCASIIWFQVVSKSAIYVFQISSKSSNASDKSDIIDSSNASNTSNAMQVMKVIQVLQVIQEMKYTNKKSNTRKASNASKTSTSGSGLTSYLQCLEMISRLSTCLKSLSYLVIVLDSRKYLNSYSYLRTLNLIQADLSGWQCFFLMG